MVATSLFFLPLFLADLDIEGGFDYGKEFMNMLFTLGIVLALILVSVWFLKKMIASRGRQLNRGASIQLLERRSLSQKSSLYLVKIEGRRVVIGDSAAGISLVCECDKEEEVEEYVEDEVEPPIREKLKRIFVKHE